MNDLKSKKTEPTKTSVLRQLATLQNMSLDQLREKWLDLYGTEPPQYKKQFLVKRLAHRIQELFYGGLSELAKSHLKKVAETDPVATQDPGGTKITGGHPARHPVCPDLERPAL
jgi:hypothetical protein